MKARHTQSGPATLDVQDVGAAYGSISRQPRSSGPIRWDEWFANFAQHDFDVRR
jgi:hypothetical protein